jgi:hypothetical protein
LANFEILPTFFDSLPRRLRIEGQQHTQESSNAD